MELREAIAKRYATKHFDARPIPIEQVRELLEMVRWAPSGINIQPWRVKIVSDPRSRPSWPRRPTTSRR